MDTNSPHSIKVNYLYFGLFFILLLLMSISSVFLKDYFLGSRFFFLLYAICQAVLEIGALIFLGWVIERYVGKISFWIYIGSLFFLCLLHICDYFLDRILDQSTWSTLLFIWGESFDEFVYLLEASGISLWMWALFGAFLLSLPLIGIGIYKGTQLLTEKRPLFLRQELFLQTLVCVPVALFLWDCSASKIIHPDAYTAFVKSLPWKFTFIQPKNITIPLASPIHLPKGESEVISLIEENSICPLAKKPNIYLFIIESFRSDFITPEIAPHLSQFKEQFIHSDASHSNANGTHPSWFSILHSQFSLFWKKYKSEGWSIGSPPLNLLKKWGYQVRVYTSAQLGYYGMDRVLFGKNLQLIDSYQTFHHGGLKEPWETDAQAIEALRNDLTGHTELQEGQVCIVFLDSTHFNYSWPKNKEATFAPFAKDFAYFSAIQSKKSIGLIKNRYRNAVHYVDSLFGNFWQSLPKKEEAIVVVTGDHAEEFFEHGHLFHNSHLIDEQTHIPLYLKLGNVSGHIFRPVISQMDIFPTIIDAIANRSLPFLEGQSLLRPPNWPYALISRFNGGRTPYEFCLHNGRSKLILQFANHSNPFSSETLKIRSLSTCKDGAVECSNDIMNWIENEFPQALERLFPNRPNGG